MPHIHEKIDFTSEVFIVHGNTVLLRKHDKYKLWLSVGGHIELDEDPVQAAIREAKEEVGLDITIEGTVLNLREEAGGFQELIPPRFLYRHHISETHEHICLVYFARSQNAEFSNQEEESSEEIRWFTFEEIQAAELTDRIRSYASCALRELA